MTIPASAISPRTVAAETGDRMQAASIARRALPALKDLLAREALLI